MPLTYIDIFAGAGGLSEGFVKNGYIPIAHVEMKKEACMTLKTRTCYYFLKKNHKIYDYNRYLKKEISRDELYALVPQELLDTVINRTMDKENMKDLYIQIDDLMRKQGASKVDVLVGGPPCQAYSLVGRARSKNNMEGDLRNYLYELYSDMLEKYQPRMFVFENVPGLLTAKKGEYFFNMRERFRQAGYELDYRVLNSKDFGVLQNRRRVILIGKRRGQKYHYPLIKSTTNTYSVADLFTDLPPIFPGEQNNTYISDPTEYLEKYSIRTEDDILTWHEARPNIERDRKIYRCVIKAWDEKKVRLKYVDLPKELCTHKNRETFLDRYKVVAADLEYAQTMVAHISKDGHYFIHPDIDQARSVSVREAARIQSFPDNYFFEGGRTAAFLQIGNAVPPLMADVIAAALKQQLTT